MNKGICKTCGKKFDYYSSRQKGIYCSIKCRDEDPTYVNPMKGKKRIDVVKYNKLEKPKCTGKNNSNWKGGVSSKLKRIRSLKEYKKWREDVLKRDNYLCRFCGNKKNLEVHHIVSLKDVWEFPFERENGITLCLECHCKIDKERCKFK